MFVDPEEVISALALTPGMNVADVGCGPGYYTFAVAPRVAGGGRVYAIDVRKNVLEKVASEAEEKELKNVEVIWGDAEKPGGTMLADEAVDVVILSNILFQVEDKDSLVREVARVLDADGRALVIDWTDSFGGLGPPQDEVVAPEDARNVFMAHGFSVAREIEPGAHHYALVFKKEGGRVE